MTHARRFREWTKVEPELRILPALCNRDGIALDIGANEGFFSSHLLPLSKSVVAFEPIPQMLARLRKNYGAKVEIHGVVLSDHEGNGVLRYPAGGYMSATVSESNSAAEESGRIIETFTAPMKTLDSFGLKNVAFVKVDVEGHEEAVLRGGLDTIKQETPILLIEIEERHAPGSLARVSALLGDCGYSGYYLDAKQLKPIEQFDPRRDQVRESSKFGGYINNFIFVPGERVDLVLAKAEQYL
jgi:FkbM family methyltransferase